MQRMPASTAAASSPAVLPTPENMIFSGGTPGGERALQLAARDDVGARAEPRERRDHRLVGIRLHGVADERRYIREGIGEHAVMPFERRGRIAIERRADGFARGSQDRPPRRASRRRDRRSGAWRVQPKCEPRIGSEATSRASMGRRSSFLPGRRDRAPPSVSVVDPARLLVRERGRRRIERPLAAARRQRQAEREQRAQRRQGTEYRTANGSRSTPRIRRTI